MDNENSPAAVIDEELNSTPETPSAIGDTTITETDDKGAVAPEETPPVSTEPDYKAQAENYKKALAQEREARKRFQRDLAERGPANQDTPQSNPEDIYSHPEFQKLLIKQAESELKEGAKDLLDQYPNVPANVKKAVLRNPRGFINPNTGTVPLALIDIQDYLEEINAELEAAPTETTPIKDVKVMGNNGPAKAADPDEVLASEAMKTPPEEWTKEQEEAVARLNAKRRN